MIRCPNCRLRNTSFDACMRCGCELKVLSTIKAQAHKMVWSAIEDKLSGENEAAEDTFSLALRLHNSELIRQLKNFVLTTDLDDLLVVEETNYDDRLETILAQGSRSVNQE